MTGSTMETGTAKESAPSLEMLFAEHLAFGAEPARSRHSSLDAVVEPARKRARAGGRCRKWRIGSFVVVVQASAGARLLRSKATKAERAGVERWTVQISRGRPTALRGAETPSRQPALTKVVLKAHPASLGDGSSAANLVTITVPEAMNPALDAAFVVHGDGEILGPRAMMLERFLLSLVDFLPDATEGDLQRLGEALHAMLLASLLRDGVVIEMGKGGAKTPLRSHVDCVITQNIGSARLDAARIAKLAGISRATFYRLFEGCGGVAAHVRQLRLERVRIDLRDPVQGSVPIAALAERSGLHSIPSFNRSFRRVYGTTPGKMRTASLAPVALDNVTPEHAGLAAHEPTEARAVRKKPMLAAASEVREGELRGAALSRLQRSTGERGAGARCTSGAASE